MVRKHQLAFAAQRFQPWDRILGALDFDVHGPSTRVQRRIQNPNLILYAAVESPVILMAAAGSQDAAIGMRGEKLANDRDTLLGSGQVVEAEFEKRFARVDFAARVLQQLLRVGKSHGDTDPR